MFHPFSFLLNKRLNQQYHLLKSLKELDTLELISMIHAASDTHRDTNYRVLQWFRRLILFEYKRTK